MLRAIQLNDCNGILTDAGLLRGLALFTWDFDSIGFTQCNDITWVGIAAVPKSTSWSAENSIKGKLREEILNQMGAARMEHLTIKGDCASLVGAIHPLLSSLTSGRFANLVSLSISQNKHVDDVFVEACSVVPTLVQINFQFCAVTQRSFAYLSELPELQELTLAFCSVKIRRERLDEDYADVFLRFGKLRYLDLSGIDFGTHDSEAMRLFILLELDALILRSCSFGSLTPIGLQYLLSNVKRIDLSNNRQLRIGFFPHPCRD